MGEGRSGEEEKGDARREERNERGEAGAGEEADGEC
jgi:hypothetical protein